MVALCNTHALSLSRFAALWRHCRKFPQPRLTNYTLGSPECVSGSITRHTTWPSSSSTAMLHAHPSVVPGSNPALRALSQIHCSVFDASRLKLRRFRCWYRVDFLFILLLLLFDANRQRIPRQNKTVNKYVNQYNWLAITIIHDIGDAFCAPFILNLHKASPPRDGLEEDCINAITWPNPIGDNSKTQKRKQAARPTGLANTFTMAQYGYSYVFGCWQMNARFATSFLTMQNSNRVSAVQWSHSSSSLFRILYW